MTFKKNFQFLHSVYFLLFQKLISIFLLSYLGPYIKFNLVEITLSSKYHTPCRVDSKTAVNNSIMCAVHGRAGGG